MRGYLESLDADAIARRFKVVVDYAYSPAVDVLPDLLDKQVEVLPLNARIDAGRVSLSQEEFRRRTQL